MNPIIINAVCCPVCKAKAGDECVSRYGCGMRLDEFLREGSFEDRLAVHLETEQILKERFPEMERGYLFVTEEELSMMEDKR